MKAFASIAFVTVFMLSGLPVSVLASSSNDIPDQPGVVRSTKISKREVKLTWKDRSRNEDGFEIQRRKESESTFRTRGTVPANVTHFIDTVQRTTVFRYRVRAFNSAGDSRWSHECFVNRTPPNKPTGVAVKIIGLTRAKITWADTSRQESGFQIQRRAPGEGFKTLGTVGRDVTEFIDDTLTPAGTFVYRVRALGKPARCIKHGKYSKERIATANGGRNGVNVSLIGNGKGNVSSHPAGITCGTLKAQCFATFPIGTTVTLTATPNATSRFKGWKGIPACIGKTGPCSFRMGTNRDVIAVFKKH